MLPKSVFPSLNEKIKPNLKLTPADGTCIPAPLGSVPMQAEAEALMLHAIMKMVRPADGFAGSVASKKGENNNNNSCWPDFCNQLQSL